MSTASTPAPRRRRRVKTPATSGKENEASININRRRPVKPLISLDDAYSFQDSSSNALGTAAISTKAQDEALRQFLDGSNDHPAAQSQWNDHPGLAECVVKASLNSKSNSGLFLLEENSSKLLSTARKLIKDATESKEAKKYRWLMVAAHILRATGPLLEQVEKQETCFRLLYHLITLSSDILSKGGEWQAGLVAIAGYEILGKMLLRYNTKTVSGETVSFEAAAGDSKGNCRFVKPVQNQRRSQIGAMPFRQISAIAFKTTLSVANCLTQLWLRTAQKDIMGADDASVCLFGADVQAIVSQHMGKDNHSHGATMELMETIYLSWLSFSAHFADEDSAKELSSHCKAAHRLLWDAASKLKGAGSKLDKHTLETYSLELRRSAVLMMLPRTSKKNSMHLILRKDHFECACSYAWKASSVFAQQTGLLQFPAAPDNPLYDFHTRVGESLDYLGPFIPMPMVYVEYCTYRALHTACGPDLPSNGAGEHVTDAECAVLSILQLGIHFRQKLETSTVENLSSSALELKYSDVNILEFVEQVVDHFNQAVLCEFDKLSSDFRSRCFKLLSMVSLHRCIFAALKEKSWQEKQIDLLGAALILARGIGPFSFELARSCDDETKIATLYDTVVECSIRPLSALETLRNDYLEGGDTDSAENLLGISDEFMERLCSVLSSDDVHASPYLSCIEKAAKVRTRSCAVSSCFLDRC
jgi:hypothetical protein